MTKVRKLIISQIPAIRCIVVATLAGLCIFVASEAVPRKFGPYIGTAVRLGNDSKGQNIACRALVIRLDEKGDACVVFDGDTLRMAAGWTKGGLRLEGLPFTGGHGRFPSHGGEKIFVTQAIPG